MRHDFSSPLLPVADSLATSTFEASVCLSQNRVTERYNSPGRIQCCCLWNLTQLKERALPPVWPTALRFLFVLQPDTKLTRILLVVLKKCNIFFRQLPRLLKKISGNIGVGASCIAICLLVPVSIISMLLFPKGVAWSCFSKLCLKTCGIL